MSDAPDFVRLGINLASAGLGAEAIACTDDFFAPVSRMLADNPAVFIPDKYDGNGKWMDGWESRRKRVPGHDHATIKLAARGRLLGFAVDTSHFTGNNAPACRIEACLSEGMPDDNAEWVEVLAKSNLDPDSAHFFACGDDSVYSHVRLHIYPDGGVARFRVYAKPVLPDLGPEEEIELTAALNGGRILGFSDAHYGSYQRLLAPGSGLNMGDGWETRRRRGPGHDWIVIALAERSLIDHGIVDTAFFKGNYPDRFSLQAAEAAGAGDEEVVEASANWPELIAETKLSADSILEIKPEAIQSHEPVTHVRLNIYPDGGVSRLKLFGRLRLEGPA